MIKCVNCHSAPYFEILKNLIENFLRYNEIGWFNANFNHSFKRGMLFYLCHWSGIYRHIK